MNTVSDVNIRQLLKKRKRKHKFQVAPTIVFLFLFIYALSILALYIWGVYTSVKTTDQFMKDMIGLPSGAPWDWAWDNYVKAFDLFVVKKLIDGYLVEFTFFDMLANSLIYSVLGPLITITITWMMAYITSQYKNKMSAFIYSANIVVMLIPAVGTLPSTLQFYKALGLYDSWGFVIVNSIGFVGTNYLIFYSFFSNVASEIKEAAMIDGAGNFTIMMRMIFPITLTMYGILFIQSFIMRWNDYFTMIIWLPSKPSLAYGLYYFSTNIETGGSWPPVQIAGSVIVMIPVLIIFFIFKDKLMSEISLGALK